MTVTVVSVPARLGEKGRVVVPAELRKFAGFHADTQVVMWSDGEGRIVMETREAARRRIWDAAPAADIDATADVRAMRDEDTQISDQNAKRRSTHRSKGSDAAAQRLLSELGL